MVFDLLVAVKRVTSKGSCTSPESSSSLQPKPVRYYGIIKQTKERLNQLQQQQQQHHNQQQQRKHATCFAAVSSETHQAVTGIIVDAIYTRSTVTTCLIHTIINI